MKAILLLHVPALLLLAANTVPTQSHGQPRQRAAVRHHFRPSAIVQPVGPAKFGDPLPGLTQEQLADFTAGGMEFQADESIEGGLGPIFNGPSCVTCHASGGVGGGVTVTVTRFGRFVNGQFDPLDMLGGSLLQQKAIDVGAIEIVPNEATVIAHRNSTPVFGLGLIEAISDRDIQRGVPRQPIDGINGRAALVQYVVSGQQRVGRFGWKAQQATILAFAGDAYLNEMGVTSRFVPTENAPNGNAAALGAFDNVADPEDEPDPLTGKGAIDSAADFMRLLAPPPTVPLTPPAQAGRQIFQQLNCTGCHTPSMTTGPSPIAALHFKPVPLYSDLLLHDMGLLGDGIAQGAAGPREMRTAPLWGLRVSAPYLHDGRAATIDDAIRVHDGEAQNPRERYLRLSPTQQQAVVAFLNSI